MVLNITALCLVMQADQETAFSISAVVPGTTLVCPVVQVDQTAVRSRTYTAELLWG